MTAIVTIEPTATDSIKKGLVRFPASTIGSAYAMTFTFFLGHQALSYALAAMFTIVTCQKLKLHAGTLVATLTAVAMIPITADHYFTAFLIRLATTSTGIIVSTVVNFFILPSINAVSHSSITFAVTVTWISPALLVSYSPIDTTGFGSLLSLTSTKSPTFKLSPTCTVTPCFAVITGASSIAQWSGLAFGVTFLMGAIVSPIWGKLGDIHGRKLMLIRASLGMAIIMTLMGFVTDVYQLVA
ncbi:aromatic acid exporter family protein, partial [Bacillus sp. B-TM1]